MGETKHQWSGVVSTLAAGAGLLSSLLLVACSNEAAKPVAAPSLAVRVVQVEPRPLEEAQDITGSLVSSMAVAMASVTWSA